MQKFKVQVWRTTTVINFNYQRSEGSCTVCKGMSYSIGRSILKNHCLCNLLLSPTLKDGGYITVLPLSIPHSHRQATVNFAHCYIMWNVFSDLSCIYSLFTENLKFPIYSRSSQIQYFLLHNSQQLYITGFLYFACSFMYVWCNTGCIFISIWHPLAVCWELRIRQYH